MERMGDLPKGPRGHKWHEHEASFFLSSCTAGQYILTRVQQSAMRHGDVVAHKGHAYRVEAVEGTLSWWDPSTQAWISPLEGAWIGRIVGPRGGVGENPGPIHPHAPPLCTTGTSSVAN